jgi:CRP-like cAMP-binding protein
LKPDATGGYARAITVGPLRLSEENGVNPLDVARRLARGVPGEGEVCDTCGSRIAGPVTVLDIPMTRSDIADFLGLTLETVSRTLTAFRRRGWMRESAHGRIERLRRDALTELTDGIGET